MRLNLVALRCPPPDLPQSIQAQFGEAGGTIGRSRTCGLPLPDPNRHISREHVEIRCRNGEFSIKVVSKLNGVQVNDTLVEPGAGMPLADGDRILVGDYLLEVRIVANAPAAAGFGATDDPFGVFATPAAPPVGSQWGTLTSFGAPAARPSEGPLEDSMPTGKLAEMLGPAAGAPVPGAGVPTAAPDPWGEADINKLLEGLSGLSPSDSVTPPPAGLGDASPALYRTDDFQQPFGGGSGPAPAAFSPSPAAPSDDIFSVLGELTGEPARPAAAPVAAPLPPVASGVPDLGAAAANGFVPSAPATSLASAGQVQAELASPLAAALAAVAPAQAATPSAPATPAAPAEAGGRGTGRRASDRPGARPAEGAPSADGAALVRALAQSLGLQPGDLDESRPEATVRVVGELLRLSLDGLYRMLQMRSQLKSELRIEDRTMIASRENNPLKHSDTVDDALTYLVDVRQHGNKLFMPPPKAVEDAVWDICAHEMALMAGTRAALLASLKLFAPDAVEGRIKKSGALDAVMPAFYKSKLWERFLEMYSELEREAEDHFDRLLNQEFAKAYSEQSKKLRKKR